MSKRDRQHITKAVEKLVYLLDKIKIKNDRNSTVPILQFVLAQISD